MMMKQLATIKPKVIITGEGAGGHVFDDLLTLFDCEATRPTSEK